jgi:hypothetical protein
MRSLALLIRLASVGVVLQPASKNSRLSSFLVVVVVVQRVSTIVVLAAMPVLLAHVYLLAAVAVAMTVPLGPQRVVVVVHSYRARSCNHDRTVMLPFLPVRIRRVVVVNLRPKLTPNSKCTLVEHQPEVPALRVP